ncbi:Bug family tripartite tricarboxylate transporter substrate binding protein [Falsiroseomonas sp. HW251]|uniref:Bug family tripartite tricarboxylate transporter substrate binding protein n=1 Tax=Falsiroseomonas sp. HW251 TaxID=3390998 RepID=UPI003D320988
MSTTVPRRFLLTAAASLALPRLALAQDFPARPIRLLIGAPPGSAPDVAARLMADRLSTLWRQPVVIDNRPGANGNLAAQITAQAPGDGHTLLFAQASILLLNEWLMRNPGYDTDRDFVAITQLMATPFMLGVRKDSPVSTLAELVAAGKAAPGRITFATTSGANLPRFAGELLKRAAGFDMTNVPYSTTAGAIQDALMGRTDLMIDGTPVIAPQVRGGQMKALALTSLRRFPGMEEIPVVAESYPGFDSVGWFGLVGPKAMPPALVARIAQDFRGVLEVPEVKERLLRDFGAEVIASPPDAFASYLARERATYRALVREVGVTLE